jgi:hypothetical protein
MVRTHDVLGGMLSVLAVSAGMPELHAAVTRKMMRTRDRACGVGFRC